MQIFFGKKHDFVVVPSPPLHPELEKTLKDLSTKMDEMKNILEKSQKAYKNLVPAEDDLKAYANLVDHEMKDSFFHHSQKKMENLDKLKELSTKIQALIEESQQS